MRAVNLLPKDITTEGRRLPPLPVLVACVGVVLVTVVLAAMYLSASAKVGDQRRALSSAQSELAAIPAPTPPPPIVGQLSQEREARVSALSTALGSRVTWDRLMRELAQVVPSDVWLTSVTAKSPVLAPAVAPGVQPQGLSLQGCTYSQESVARFLARLDLVPDLSQMTLGSSGTGSGGSSAGTSTGTGCPSGMFGFEMFGTVRTAGSP